MLSPELRTMKDGTERWRIRYRINGKQKPITFIRKKDAAQFATWVDKYGAEGALSMLDARQMVGRDESTFSEWCTAHIDALSGVTGGTLDTYRAYVRRDLGELGAMPVSAIRDLHISQWVTWMQQRGQSGKTIANKHGFMYSAFKRAVKDGVVQSNPCADTRLPETIRRPMTVLTHEEFTRFLGCFTAEWIPMVQVLFGTGARFGEITALTVGDLDLDSGTIDINKAWKKNGQLGPPKSPMSVRNLAISREIVTVLRMHTDGMPGDALVFSGEAGNRITSSQFHQRVWQPAVTLANGEVPTRQRGPGETRTRFRNGLTPLNPSLGKRPRVHDARHTCASWLLRRGVPIFDVSRHMGHESIVTTTRVYGHMLPSAQNDIRAALSLGLSASSPELLP